jgi:hypothetical protein
LYTTGTGSFGSNAGRIVGKKWVGVTRSMFSAPWAINSSKICRNPAESTSLPTGSPEIARFWQYLQPRVHPPKKTAPLLPLGARAGSSHRCSIVLATSAISGQRQ